MADKCKRCGACKECGAVPGGYYPAYPYPYQVQPYPISPYPNGTNPYPLTWKYNTSGTSLGQ